MKQVTEKTVRVFVSTDTNTISMGNTVVTYNQSSNEKALLLHGNVIAFHNLNNGKIHISNCGWDTNTTKERLNAILFMCWDMDTYCKNSIYTKNGQWFWMGNTKKDRKEFPYGEMVEII